jgi:bifunctional non-homologous end joining protein LigD
MSSRQGGEQLSLHIGDSDRATASRQRVRPMLPLTGEQPFDDPAWFFAPWWPGTPAMAYIENGRLQLETEHLADPLAAFPELADIGAQFRDSRLIVEGTLLALDDEGRPDIELLRDRLANAGVRRGTPAFVASDLLDVDGRTLITLPFERRRELLAEQLSDGERCVIDRGLRGEGLTLADAVASMGLGEISARLLAARYRPGQQDGSWLRLPVAQAPAVPTRPLLAVLQRLPL